ncbi:SusD/RagB family nutrient-binding outer membrane lipoprotein [Gynurincola endophyticus]|uniref:SusD/RagB family nutrient-binding outer membrane lipoprotein n=1 Tax=Gynurincola endophyticus TaxID=2479004 RepID=UPI000F8D5C39|nr:SusD/RagB family nutrient-binding outer membrane lipoprotein [Gynurincola endophyticus]
MKKLKYILGALILLSCFQACKKSDFGDYYRDPGKVTESSVEKQFAGYIYTSRELVVPSYWNYFVVMRTTMVRYVQAGGYVNEQNLLNLGAAASGDRWSNYYTALAQYRELEFIYSNVSEEEKNDKKIFMLAAKIFIYDQTQQVVDLHGAIPWSQAGKLRTNDGNYDLSYAKYDAAETIYTTMLDDLKSMSDELNTINLSASIAAIFKGQDIINDGDLNKWKKYCNSLRIRMLMRVKSAPAFAARVQTEIDQILADPTAYPIVLTTPENIRIDIFNVGSPINSSGLRDALESWNFNLAGEKMINQLKTTNDPRINYMFQPGDSAGNVITGLDPMLSSGAQNVLVASGDLAIYNRSTYSRNQYFPGIIISAAEIQFYLAEHWLDKSNAANARTAFEEGVRASIEQLVRIRTVSNDNSVPAPTVPSAGAITTFINGLNWAGTANKMQLLATQKWVHYNIIQPLQNWAEVRRLDYPTFNFRIDASDIQQAVPVRWTLPPSEVNFNAENYKEVSANDNLNTRLFWDIQ